MKLKELIPIIVDDTDITIERKDKVVWKENVMKFKPYSIEIQNGRKWLDDCEVDFIVPDDLDELIIVLM